MANIGATTAFYKVETSLTKANNEVSKSMERLATGKQNASAGDRSSYVAMADTFRLDFVGTKAGIKGANVVMGYLETAMRTLDGASALLSRLQELAVLGANQTNTTEDANAIDAEAEAIADEFNRLLDTAKYKGKDLFMTNANDQYVSLGGRNANMTFGVQKIDYSAMIAVTTAVSDTALSTTYQVVVDDLTAEDKLKIVQASNLTSVDQVVKYAIFTTNGDDTDGTVDTDGVLSTIAHANVTGLSSTGALSKSGIAAYPAGAFNLVAKPSDGANSTTNTFTAKIEAVQNDINNRRVQAGSQYAALESAVNYITDLTAQYELGYNTVNDVNFSMETAHLAKNQILQQAATAMLAQANTGQQSLLQLIQG